MFHQFWYSWQPEPFLNYNFRPDCISRRHVAFSGLKNVRIFYYFHLSHHIRGPNTDAIDSLMFLSKMSVQVVPTLCSENTLVASFAIYSPEQPINRFGQVWLGQDSDSTVFHTLHQYSACPTFLDSRSFVTLSNSDSPRLSFCSCSLAMCSYMYSLYGNSFPHLTHPMLLRSCTPWPLFSVQLSQFPQ